MTIHKKRIMSKKNILMASALFISMLTATSFANTTCTAKKKKATPALFTQFTYQGNDQVYTDNPLNGDEFYTPILQGCYPDPSITRKGDDYYLVNSSFAF